jgi:hypothetical protein
MSALPFKWSFSLVGPKVQYDRRASARTWDDEEIGPYSVEEDFGWPGCKGQCPGMEALASEYYIPIHLQRARKLGIKGSL